MGLTEGISNAFRFGISDGKAAKLGYVPFNSPGVFEHRGTGFIKEGPNVLAGQILWVAFPVEEELWSSAFVDIGPC